MARAPKLKVVIKAGNSHKGFSSSKNVVAEELTGDIQKFVTKNSRRRFRVDGPKLAAMIEKACARIITRVAPYIAKSVMGTPSAPPRSVTRVETEDGENLIEWMALEFRTQRRRKTRRHFVDTGELRKVIAASGPAILAGTGGVKATVKTTPEAPPYGQRRKIHKLGEITVHVAPKIGGSTLPGLTSGAWTDHRPDLRFERKLGFDQKTLTKLAGPVDGRGREYRHRPLMQPVLSYWLMFKVPDEITRVLDREFARAKGSVSSQMEGT